MMNELTPCIIGVAQQTCRPENGDAPEPIEQCMQVALAAAQDSGNSEILKRIDELDSVLSLSWSYDDLPVKLADKLGLKDGERKLSGLSGTHPQRFINEAAENILAGKRDAVLIAGAESFATRKRAKKEERKLAWPKAEKKAAPPFEDPFHPSEMAHEVFQAYTTFALLDSARRAHLGLSHEANRHQQANMMAALSKVAANNPKAWFQKSYSGDELFDINDNNRMVAYPFTKNTMAFMDVDMAAAVIVTSHKVAEELNIPQERRVYLHGWGYAKEPPYIAQRPELWHCPSMKHASQQALTMAGVGIDDIAHLDLYSCFSSSLNFTKDALGIGADDSRPLTITGGLPYFGGPGNNYTSHSVATMVEKLRNNSKDFGLISGVGMHMTNHVFAVYSAKPVTTYHSCSTNNEALDLKTITDEASGAATIAGYTVVHSRQGKSALAVCDLVDGTRCYARCNDENMLDSMEQEEWVGRTIKLSTDAAINLISS